jgi:ABC-type multidrug transport system fused ATPase/permease subunit
MSLFDLFKKKLKKELMVLSLSFAFATTVPIIFIRFCLKNQSSILYYFRIEKSPFAIILNPLIFLFLGYVVLQTIHFIVGLLLSFSLPRIQREMKLYMLENVQKIPLSEFRKLNNGEFERLISSFSEGFNNCIELILFGVWPLFVSCCECFFQAIKCSNRVALFSIGRLLLFGLITFISFRSIIKKQNELNDIRFTQSGVITDIMKNILVEKLYNSSAYSQNRFLKLQDLDDKTYSSLNIYLGFQKFLLGNLNILFWLIFLLIIAKLKDTNIYMNTDFLFNISFKFTKDIWDILVLVLPTFYAVGRFTKSWKELRKYQKLISVDSTHVKNLIFNKLEIKNLTFNYNEQNIFKNFDMSIDENGLYVIKAPSGKGKSSLFSFLTALVSVDNNTIFFNDIAIEDINKYDLNKNLVLIPQEDLIYNDTIRNNIIMNREIEEEEFASICKQLKINDFANSFFHKYEHICGTSGNMISGGQAKRISFARALLSPCNILLIDEPFNNLDNNLVDDFLNIIKNYAKNKIVICADHTGLIEKNANKIFII